MPDSSQSAIINQNSETKAPEKSVTLGVVAISYNEERDLPGFLENLLPWVDEIVIVDDGSSDRTEAIARAAGKQVRFMTNRRSEEEGFAGQRNVGIRQISTDWVLNMDIDERVPTNLRDEILNNIENREKNAYRYRRLNFFLHRKMLAGGWDSWNNPQLARKNKHHYEGKVHERAIIEGDADAIGQLQAAMWHLNDEGYAERMRKSQQYCQLEAEKLLASGKKVSGLSLILYPVLEFIKKYLIKQGLRDGVPGLIAALHSASAIFRTRALVWDEQNGIPREALEAKVKSDE